MNWEHHFAQRTNLFRRNTVREFLKLAGQPGIISFAGGLPASDLLPVEELKIATEETLVRFGAKALQYGPSEGVPELRDLISRRFSEIGATAENILITSGSQQALDLVGRVLLDPGNWVSVQNPTYLAALSAWAPYGVSFRSLQSLDQQWDRVKAANLAYIVPNFSNPAGETMDLPSRCELLKTCIAESTPLIEDDAYGELRFEGEPIPSIVRICGNPNGPVIHVGTFSKVLAPGLRLGWIVAAPELISKLVQARQAADLHTSTFTQYVALQAVQNGVIERALPRIRSVYRAKRDTMLQALASGMPEGTTWSRPEGGMFVMLRFPLGTNARQIARRAQEIGVLVVPGEEFHIEGGTETLRLNFSNPTVEQISTGIRRLAEIATEEIAAVNG